VAGLPVAAYLVLSYAALAKWSAGVGNDLRRRRKLY
jgi:hypothetical protein